MKKTFLALGFFAILWHLYIFIPVVFPVEKDIGELKIYDRKNVLITHLPQPGGFQIPIGEDEPVPENLANAFITIEDERFRSHWGIDAFAKLRAFKDNLKAKKIVSGGSTITEQLVKNKYYLHSPRSIPQKLREATLAFYFSIFISKEEVLRDYLDTIYFGHRNYGIKAAMKSYFDKAHLETVTEEEIITLLAIIRSPGVINLNEKYFQDRWQRISASLHPTLPTLPTLPNSLSPFPGLNLFPHVTASIQQLISPTYPTYRTYPTYPEFFTTLDSSLQTKAEELINLSLTRLSEKNVTNGAAYIVQPKTGEILAWVGSKDFNDKKIDGQVNIITQKRQMGSALKPFIYLYAFSQGAHPDQLIVDLEKDFESGKQDEAYRPLNYGLREGGVMSLKLALANSFNIASVRLLEHLGLENTYRFMKNLGLEFDYPAEHYGLSLALGSPDLNMQNVADTYGTLANNGVQVRSHIIREVGKGFGFGSWYGDRDRSEGVVPHTNNQNYTSRQNQTLNPYSHLFTTLSDPLNRRRSFGVNSILNTTIPFAVKTGTTKNFHDNWTFGYHPDLVVATWVGNNDNSPMIDVDGITGAGPIWHRLTEFAIQQGYVNPSSLYSPFSLLPTISDPDSGHYCLEDFFIKDIKPAEISKIAKLFDFKDFKIEWCNSQAGANGTSRRDVRSYVSTEAGYSPAANELTILKPSSNETFYIRQDIPLELQQIILKANQEVEWLLDNSRVGYGENIFIQPTQGKHTITAKTPNSNTSVVIEVLWNP